MRAIFLIILLILRINLFKNLQMALALNQANSTKRTSWDECLPTHRVIGGEIINITEAPFILKIEALGFPQDTAYLHCGATILSETVALTAAHCVKLTSGSSTIGFGNIHNVIKVIRHENYGVGATVNQDHDIALLFVENPFRFSDSVQPIKLPTKDLKEGTFAMVAGYGRTQIRPRSSNDINHSALRRTSVPIIDLNMCSKVIMKKFLERYNKTYPNLVTKRMICAGYPNGQYDPCAGDSGGPLYLNKTIYGVISWGVSCALDCAPGVYTNVYKMIDWINKTMEKNKN